MKSVNQDDSVFQKEGSLHQGTTIITVAPREEDAYRSPSPKKSKRKADARRQKLPKIMNQYNEQPESEVPQQEHKEGERNSQSKMRGVDEETAGQIQQNGLSNPYEFLVQRSPSILRIFFPRFTLKSITLVLSLIYIVAFIALMGYNYSKSQTTITWNCSLYQTQNKYFPRLNQNHQIWRVFTSAIFHSNIAHFCLDLFAIQIYGYFIEWYYGKVSYAITIFAAVVYSHFFAAAVQKTSVSTTSSSILMAIVALKIYFLWEYRSYRKLLDRRNFLYILLALIVGINFIPIFVVNNVDYSAHLGGFFAGALLGMFFLKKKLQQPTCLDLLLKWGSLSILLVTFILLVALVFSASDPDYYFLATQIDHQCSKNQP